MLAITAEARHTKKTQTQGNAKMLSLNEKMRQRLPAPRFYPQVRMNPLLMKMKQHALKVKTQVEDDDDCLYPEHICVDWSIPAEYCCPDSDWTCCEGDSDYICALDPDDC